MTEENKALAYELYLQHRSYADIAAHLEAKQGDVIRAAVAFLAIPALVVMIGWAQLGFSAVEAITGIRGWVWLLLGVVAGIAGFASELSGGGDK